MAPEVLCGMNHSFSADFFALGVIVYEFMFGKVLNCLLRGRILEETGKKFVI